MSRSIESVPDKITTARVKLLFSHPFFGNLATRLKVVEASDWCKTAATDGRHLFYNLEFFEKLSINEIEFVVAHELLHNVFDHMRRVDDRHRKVWNFATDYAVNGQLVRDKIGTVPAKINILHDAKYYGKGSEEIYDELYQNHKDMLDKLGQLLDDHIDWSNEDGDADPNQPTYTKEELQGIRDEVIESVIQAAQTAGNVPAEIGRMIKQMTEPKMNWREILRNQIQSILKNDFTWTRPSRKTMAYGIYLPSSNYDETIDVCIALDMSGSITDHQAGIFLSEVKGIMDEYKEYKIKIWCFDTRVYNEQDFSSDNGDDITSYQIAGGGGTSFECNWEYMKENNIEPKKFIMFTDMYPCGGWGDEDYCDTIFLGHGTNSIVAPFGTTIYYEE